MKPDVGSSHPSQSVAEHTAIGPREYLDEFLSTPYDAEKADLATVNVLFDKFNKDFYTSPGDTKTDVKNRMMKHIYRSVDNSVTMEQIRKGDTLYDLYDKSLRLGLDGHISRKIFELALGYFTGFTEDFEASEYLVAKRVLDHMVRSCNGQLTEGYCSSHAGVMKQMLVKLSDLFKSPEYGHDSRQLFKQIEKQVIEAVGEADSAYVLPYCE